MRLLLLMAFSLATLTACGDSAESGGNGTGGGDPDGGSATGAADPSGAGTAGGAGGGNEGGSVSMGGSEPMGGAPTGPVFYIDPVEGDDANDGSEASPRRTIEKGIELFEDGGNNTLMLRDGTYSDPLDQLTSLSKTGTASSWNTVRAYTDGGAVIDAGLDLHQDDAYTQFVGLAWKADEQKNITGSYLKFRRCAFEGGAPSGNTATVTIGTNDFTPGADHVLLEDSWVYGYGGRYKVLVYNATNVVLRRVVTRFDGFDPDNDAPEADVTVYDSENVAVQNAIAIDSVTDETAGQYVASFYNALNGTTSTPNATRSWRGCIAVNTAGYLMGTEGQQTITGQTVEDCASFGGTYGISQLKGTNVSYRRITIVDADGDGFGMFGGSQSIADSVVMGCSGQALNGGSCQGCVAFDNDGGNGGATALNPSRNGLEYLPRIEGGSPLATGGTGNGQRGARIEKQIGEAGTLYGEPGYDTETDIDLWPWPNQDRIKADMAALSTRGFCAADQSLTQYIFERLGNPSPY